MSTSKVKQFSWDYFASTLYILNGVFVLPNNNTTN